MYITIVQLLINTDFKGQFHFEFKTSTYLHSKVILTNRQCNVCVMNKQVSKMTKLNKSGWVSLILNLYEKIRNISKFLPISLVVVF